jgi:hypothetical protein
MAKGAADFSKSSKTEEQYTPREWWQRVIMVMGRIDVDPSADLEKRIPAGTHYTKIDNGLTKPWIGAVYNNPPFGHGVGRWFTKLRDEFAKGNCTEAIVCWKCALETHATRTLINIPEYRVSAVPNGRISFLSGDDLNHHSTGEVATFTPMFYYFGLHEQKFMRIFSPHATLWRPVRITENQKNLTEDR